MREDSPPPTCHTSHVTCHIFFTKVVKLVSVWSDRFFQFQPTYLVENKDSCISFCHYSLVLLSQELEEILRTYKLLKKKKIYSIKKRNFFKDFFLRMYIYVFGFFHLCSHNPVTPAQPRTGIGLSEKSH